MIKQTDWGESGHGFVISFENGWSVSVQQSKAHNCTKGKSVEVGIFDSDDEWRGFSETDEVMPLVPVNVGPINYVSADLLARILSTVQQQASCTRRV